jgi:tetratricopeptide (TPR) repeat protein
LDNYRKALKIWPDSVSVLQNLAAVLFEMERYDEALVAYRRALELDPKLFERQSAGGVATLIQTNQQNSMMTNFSMAKLFAGMGDKERAISSLYKAYDNGFRDVGKIKAEPAFASLAGDERFLRLIETMSLPGGPQT